LNEGCREGGEKSVELEGLGGATETCQDSSEQVAQARYGFGPGNADE
jgi:hypothetical protein